jgi:hypothetical protein
MLSRLEEDFQPDPATLERYAPKIEELEASYLTIAREIHRKEMEELEP